MPGQRARRQHTAAKTYLRGFADEADHVVMHARDGVVETRNIASASVIRDFYTFTNEEGQATEVVEEWLGQSVENDIASVLRELPSADRVNSDWIAPLSMFVVTSLLRTATVRVFMDQIDEHLRPMLVLLEVAKRQQLDLSSLSQARRKRLLFTAKEALCRVPADKDHERRSHLRTMLRTVDEWTPRLVKWDWEIARAPEPVLLTSDSPVVVLRPIPSESWHGVLPTDSTLAVPIDPLTLILATPYPMLGYGAVTRQLATHVNGDIVRNCYKAAFRHVDTPWPLDLQISAQHPKLSEPTISWGAAPDGAPSTFPARCPEVEDPVIRELLDDLGAVDIVE